MKSSQGVGILGYGVYLPKYRLPATEIARIWRGSAPTPYRQKAVAAQDEDAATMAVEAARRAMEMIGDKEVGAIFVGTESKPYAVKPTSTIVAQALGQHRILAADLEFACKAGTEAMQIVMGLVGSGMIARGLAIAVDTAQGKPGDELEYTSASGAACIVLGRIGDEPIAEIEASTSYVSDTPDFWRRPSESYPRHLSRFTGEPAYFHHIESAVRELFDETGLGPQDFQYAVFHQPNPRFPLEVGQRLGFSLEQMKVGLLNPSIGNTYSASSPLGLAAVLDEAQPGERILLASFGSGAGSDAFSIRVLKGITEKRRRARPIREMVEKGESIDYALYSKFRSKLHR